MTDKLSEEKLIEIMKSWCRVLGDDNHWNKAGWEDGQAYKQIVALIKKYFKYEEEVRKSVTALKKMRERIQEKPQVTEEWIEDKASGLAVSLEVTDNFRLARIKNFIHSLIKELRK